MNLTMRKGESEEECGAAPHTSASILLRSSLSCPPMEDFEMSDNGHMLKDHDLASEAIENFQVPLGYERIGKFVYIRYELTYEVDFWQLQ